MNAKPETTQILPHDIPVEGRLHRPTKPNGDSLILTHGAGTNSDAPLLVALAEAFCSAGFTVLRYDLPFRQFRPNGPPPRGSAERDQQGLKAAVQSMREQTTDRIYLGGHSYGGRQASILAATEAGPGNPVQTATGQLEPDLPEPNLSRPILIDGLLLLSYPLHPPQRPTELRTAHFPNLKTPALFVHGARDGFATMEELSAALKLIPAPTRLLSIPAAGHELLTKTNRRTLPNQIVEALRQFAAEVIA